MALEHPKGKNRIYIWLGGDAFLNSDEEHHMKKLLNDIIGGTHHIRNMKFEYLFEDGSDVGCLAIKLRSHLTFDDAVSIANTIRHSSDICKGKIEKFNQWFKSAHAFTLAPTSRRHCIVNKE